MQACNNGTQRILVGLYLVLVNQIVIYVHISQRSHTVNPSQRPRRQRMPPSRRGGWNQAMEKAPVRGRLKRLPDWTVKTNINIQSVGNFYQKVALLTQVQIMYASEDDIDETVQEKFSLSCRNA